MITRNSFVKTTASIVRARRLGGGIRSITPIHLTASQLGRGDAGSMDSGGAPLFIGGKSADKEP